MGQSIDLLVRELPDGWDRWGSPEGVSFVLGEEVDALVLAVRSPATTFRHSIFLSPDHLASEEVSMIAKADYQAMWDCQEISIA